MNKFNDYFEHILNSYVLSGINNIRPLEMVPSNSDNRYLGVPHHRITVDNELHTTTYDNRHGEQITVQDITDDFNPLNYNNTSTNTLVFSSAASSLPPSRYRSPTGGSVGRLLRPSIRNCRFCAGFLSCCRRSCSSRASTTCRSRIRARSISSGRS